MIITLIYTTTSSLESAKHLAHGFIESKNAACVQIIPGLLSLYEWENALQETSEWAILIKTSVQKKKEALSWLMENHPYDTPGVIIRDVETTEPFAHWVGSFVGV